ncbi:ubiquitin carboxyl-terminal hydrolase 16 [Carica papaya]|uniref:ubiquitin carboxyl-terminal hydrolase 16 n=1 Tax=Carica papaya TaxID=3649 RepID=UPI000B8CD2E1|nr:ubiquitin carboxyl-terminal hydrolase 16 [Carica papaya]
MHLSGDLGFSSLVLVVCLVFPLIGFVIRRKWRIAAVRKEEIKRLLVLASEEAARAELEASASYGTVSISRGYHCAVCFCPTTTRCARCKVVRYCSGKCQIIHWRQGHKDECHPRDTIFRGNDEGKNYVKEVAEQDQPKRYGDRLENEDRKLAKSVETSTRESVLFDSINSSDIRQVNVDGIKVEFCAHEEETNSARESSVTSFSSFATASIGSDSSDDVSVCESDDVKVEFYVDEVVTSAAESSGTSFSGFSSSPSGSESSDDVSISESIGSHEPERSESSLPADIAIDLMTTNDMDTAKPVSPKFTCLVESVDNFAKLNKVDKTRSGGCNSESQCASSGYLRVDASGKNEGSVAEGPSLSSSFWGRTLESFESISDACDDSAILKHNEAGDSISESGSSLRFSFSFSRSTPSHARSSEVHKNVQNGAVLASLGNNKSTYEVAVSENKSSTSSRLSLSGSKEVKPSSSLITSSPSILQPSPSVGGVSMSKGASNGIVKDHCNPSQPLRPGDVRHSSSSATNIHISPNYEEHSIHASKCPNYGERSIHASKYGNVTCAETNSTNDSQVISSPNGKNGLKTSVLKVVDQFRGSKLLKHNPAVVGNEMTAGKYSDKGVFSYELFVKLYNCNKLELQPCGLINCGNSCYANAVLQCLTFTPPLTAYFLQGLHSKACMCFRALHFWCKSYEKAKKKLQILEAPNVLTIALKRFQSGKFGKLNKPIRFPEILDLAPYMSGTSDKSPIYRLYGVVVHLDIMNAAFSGHYVCYVKNFQNKWFKIDDSTVMASELERVLAKGAYMLFYARCSPRAPRLIRNRLASSDPKNKPVLSRTNGRSITSNSKSASRHSPDVRVDASSSIIDSPTKCHRLQRILEEDSSSDSSSLISSNSDEGSSSTDSTRDSTGTDEFSDYIFGDLGRGWNSSWRNSDSDTSSSSSSSPMYSRHSPLSDLDRYASGFAGTSKYNTTDEISSVSSSESVLEGCRGGSRLGSSEGKVTVPPFLKSDRNSRQCRKLDNSNNSYRETDSEKVGWINHVKSGVSFRKSSRERTE